MSKSARLHAPASVLALFAGVVFCHAAFAQAAAPSETVIVTGTKDDDFGAKSGIPLSQVPQSVQVMSSDEFEDRDIRSISDVLKSVPSATVGASRTSTYQFFGRKIRGFRADEMRNGVRQRYFGNIDPSATSDIERVEVLKGPSGVLFGDGAVGGGIVSVITKQPQHDFAASAGALVGSYDQKLANFDVTGPVGEGTGLYFRLDGEIERSGTFINYTDLNRENAAFSLLWEPTSNVTAHFVGEWLERRTRRNAGLPVVGTVVSNGVATIPRNAFLSDPKGSAFTADGPLLQLWVDWKLDDVWTLTPRVSYAGFDGIYDELNLRGVNADKVTVNRVGRHDEEHHHYPIEQLDLNGLVNALGMKHNILTGVEYAEWRVRYIEQTIPGVPAINSLAPTYGNLPAGPWPVTSVSKTAIDSWALYLQDRVDVTDNWNIVLSGRASWYAVSRQLAAAVGGAATNTHNIFDHPSFEIGSTYRLGDGWSVFGGYATGFSIESTATGRSFDGEPFDPEESRQMEGGLRYDLEGVSASASLFQINRTNVVTTDPNHLGFSIQTGDVQNQGVELEGTWRITDALSMQAGYAYMNGKVVKSDSGNIGFKMADTPHHMANLFASYAIPGLPLELHGGFNFVDARPFSDTANVTVGPGLLANQVMLPSYATADLGATWRFERVRFDLSVHNVTDSTYFTKDFNEYSVIPGDPRQVDLRMTWDIQ